MGAKQMTTERQLQTRTASRGGSRRVPAYAGAPACGMLSRPTTADTNNSPSSSFTDSLKCGGIPASSEQDHPDASGRFQLRFRYRGRSGY